MPNTISKINGYSLKDNVSGYLTESVYYCEINVTTTKLDWSSDYTPSDLRYSVTTVNSDDTFSKISGLINSGINVVLRESANSSFYTGLTYSLIEWNSDSQVMKFHVNLPLMNQVPAGSIISPISEVAISWDSSSIIFSAEAIDATTPIRLPLLGGTYLNYTISGGNLKYIFNNISTSEPGVDRLGINYSYMSPGNIIILSNMTSSAISLSSSSGVKLSLKYLYPDNREMSLYEGYLYANGTPSDGAPLTEFSLNPNESALFVLGLSGFFQAGGSGGGMVLRTWYETPVS